MIEVSKPHFPSFRLSVMLVMLGVCVFLWGSAYKLSLYDMHRPTLHPIPEAKLLSKNEDPNATDSLRLSIVSVVSDYGALFLIAASMVFWSIGSSWPADNKFLKRPDRSKFQLELIQSAFSFRPPPIHLLR